MSVAVLFYGSVSPLMVGAVLAALAVGSIWMRAGHLAERKRLALALLVAIAMAGAVMSASGIPLYIMSCEECQARYSWLFCFSIWNWCF